MRIERKDDVTVYKIDWIDLVTILETPVITSIRILCYNSEYQQ